MIFNFHREKFISDNCQKALYKLYIVYIISKTFYIYIFGWSLDRHNDFYFVVHIHWHVLKSATEKKKNSCNIGLSLSLEQKGVQEIVFIHKAANLTMKMKTNGIWRNITIYICTHLLTDALGLYEVF